MKDQLVFDNYLNKRSQAQVNRWNKGEFTYQPPKNEQVECPYCGKQMSRQYFADIKKGHFAVKKNEQCVIDRQALERRNSLRK